MLKELPTDDDEKLRTSTIERLMEVAQQEGVEYDLSTLSSFVSSARDTGAPLQIHDSTCSWNQYFSVLSFLLNGHLHAEYVRLSGLLGLPACSHTQWHRIVERLETHVTKLAEWSCSQVRERIVQRGDKEKRVASFDGLYLTRGHYSNNSSLPTEPNGGQGITGKVHLEVQKVTCSMRSFKKSSQLVFSSVRSSPTRTHRQMPSSVTTSLREQLRTVLITAPRIFIEKNKCEVTFYSTLSLDVRYLRTSSNCSAGHAAFVASECQKHF